MCHRLIRTQRGVGSLHSTLKYICQIRRQLAEWEEWPELLAFLWGSKRHKRSPIIPCWNKSDTNTAVGEGKKKEKRKKRSLTGAKGQIQLLKLRLVIQGNPAFNKNKYLRGGKGSSNDSLQATEGIQLDQQKRQYQKDIWDLTLLQSNKQWEATPKKSCDSMWIADYPAAVKVQPL